MDISPVAIESPAVVRTPAVTVNTPTSVQILRFNRSASVPTSRKYAVVSGVQLEVNVSAELHVEIVAPEIELPVGSGVRATPSININVQTPALQKGLPQNPDCWSLGEVEATAAAPIVIPDPPPKVVPATGHSSLMWEASDLPAIGSTLNEWSEANGGPSWYSKSPYSPSVESSAWPPGKGALFTYWNTEHMWLDIGEPLSHYTVLIDAILISYPTARYGHYLLDAGKEPPALDTNGGKDYWIGFEGLSTRSVMLYRQNWAVGGTNQLEDISYGTHLRPDHDPTLNRHRVFYSVFHGAEGSRLGSFDENNWYTDFGPYDAAANQYLVLGRRQSQISDNFATHMMVSEVRIFKAALSWDQLVAQYKHMASKYDHGLSGSTTSRRK